MKVKIQNHGAVILYKKGNDNHVANTRKEIGKQIQELIDENKKLKAKVLELEYWQQLSNDFIRDHHKVYDKWKLKQKP